MKFLAMSIGSSSLPWVWSLLGASAGLYLFYRGFQLLQRKRLIMNTPASKIRSAAIGLVEVNGLAAGPFTLTAPITGVPCYCYRTVAWQWKREDRDSKWVQVADECFHVPFYLQDGTGRVLVNPQGAEMQIHRDFQEEFSDSLFSSSLEGPGNVAAFLLAHGVSSDCRVKVEEYCIKPKNALFILGTLAENPGLTVSAVPVRSQPSMHGTSLNLPFSLGEASFYSTASLTKTAAFPAFNDGMSKEFTQSSSNSRLTHQLDPAQQAKIAAALTKAGIYNPAAWAAAGINRPSTVTTLAGTAAATAAAAAPAPENFDLHPPVVLMKGTHNSLFFISWRGQREVVKSLGWKSALMIWGGPALCLLCLYILAAEFGWL